MRYRKAKAVLHEVIQSECPYCGADYKDIEPGWRDKPGEEGLSFHPVNCQKGTCRKLFVLNFNQSTNT